MKWLWLTLLGLAAPLLVLLAFALALHRPGLPVAAQKSLDAYLAQRAAAGQPLRVAAAELAAHRRALTAGMSAASFGGSYYFNENGFNEDGFNENGRTAPYPPTDLWCVTLTGAGESTTVFVAQHEDMYVGTWLVHEPVAPEAVAAVCK